MIMDESVRIAWRGIAPQAAAEALARQEAARLAAWYPDLKVWQVVLEAAGSPTEAACASIEVRGWQRQVIVNRAHADARVALKEAFDALFRKFERRARPDRRATRPRNKELRAA